MLKKIKRVAAGRNVNLWKDVKLAKGINPQEVPNNLTRITNYKLILVN